MQRHSHPTLTLCTTLFLTALLPTRADAQYFGRNKVQYDAFDFRWRPTEHFRIYFYPAESLAANDAGRQAERWYTRHRALFGTTFADNPLIFYADAPDFQQSNVIEETIGQGTGGVTEGLRDRVIMPFTGSYAETDHVLGHELVHVFQYREAQRRGDLNALSAIPLWVIEGMAEYLSVGRRDPNTAMWVRDAIVHNDVPTMSDLSRSSRYFPYRYGQAVWAYIAGAWGDSVVPQLYRSALERGWEPAVRATLGLDVDVLSTRWAADIRQRWGRLVSERTPGTSIGRAIAPATGPGDQHISPSVSPDGRHVAYFSSRELLGIDLFVAEVATGRVIRRLTSVTTDAHYDALSFISTTGTWSPDSRRFAFVVFAGGNQQIEIMNVAQSRVERSIKVPGVGAMSDPAWSPDGRRMAFVGMQGGIADLYVHDLQTGATQRLTTDRATQRHPAWAPDSRSLVFVTDAVDGGAFDRFAPGPLRLATLELSSGTRTLLPRYGAGKEINPQYSPNGRSLFFISDADGVSDVYRRDLTSGLVYRVTRVATGVSGITGGSPAISVSSATGALAFSVFDRQGYSIRVLDAAATAGEPVTPTVDLSAGLLAPLPVPLNVVDAQLNDPVLGLPTEASQPSHRYSSQLSLDYVSGPAIGVSVGGGYGTGVAGGVALGFSDMLGNRVVQAVVQAQGRIQDAGAQVLYLNRERRWNWGGQVYHIPYAAAFASYRPGTIVINGQPMAATVYAQTVQRIFFDEAQALAQYPLSSTRRFELAAGAQRITFDADLDSIYVVGGGVVREVRRDAPGATGLTFATGTAAFVEDNAYFGFTSPIAGARSRFEVAPSIGSLSFFTLLGDTRRYLFLRPFALAGRLLHYGRYGPDASHDRLGQLFVGQPYLMRGYESGSFDVTECVPIPGATDDCPQYTRLAGSRLAVLNLEFRVPLLGNERFGLVPLSFLPVELAPFLDVGAAWSDGSPVKWRYDRTTSERVPVISTGVSARLNLFGFAVVEIYRAKPLHRPGKSWVTGLALQPGW